MSTLAAVEPLSPYSQIQQFSSSICSLFSSIFESEEDAFERVVVEKKDVPGIKFYIVDRKTGAMYLDEMNFIIAAKCVAIALAAPAYTFWKIGWFFCKTPIEITVIALETLERISKEAALCRPYESVVALNHGIVQILECFGNGLFEIVKAPIFGLSLELGWVGSLNLSTPEDASLRLKMLGKKGPLTKKTFLSCLYVLEKIAGKLLLKIFMICISFIWLVVSKFEETSTTPALLLSKKSRFILLEYNTIRKSLRDC